MPLDKNIRKVLIIGSGPIVIGQAAEFDYAGTQAVLAVREEGVQVVLVNNNPATIQTDPGMADKVYIEPLTVDSVEAIIAREKPDGLIATMGGQTALNLAVQLDKAGVLERHNVRLLGTNIPTIQQAEDRLAFADLMESVGQPVLPHTAVSSLDEARDFATQYGYPLVVRSPFRLGGAGSGHASDWAGLEKLVNDGLDGSSTGNVLLERSVLGWAEVEYEVLRDGAGNAIIVCNMENMDPMGVHTGESIVVAPSQTLSDADYHRLRTISLNIVHALGVKGGCNCQLALNQYTGEIAIIEVNPRLSRSSALASKATGYPIARVAAKIALGYTLTELRNGITGASACAEPALDYLVVKLPRWPFDKFRGVDHRIGMTMKSTGEVMAIGRSFEEALLKALRSLDVGSSWLSANAGWTEERITETLIHPTHERPAAIYNAIDRGWSAEEISRLSNIHPWFIARFTAIYEMEQRWRRDPSPQNLAAAKQMGFADDHLAAILQNSALPAGVSLTQVSAKHQNGNGTAVAHESIAPATDSLQGEEITGMAIRRWRQALGIYPTYKMVDTCAGEFAASTPYFYSTYEQEDEALPMDGKKAIVLGSGPIRIGQGIEFDYSSVHAVQALREAGIKAIVINNNPETVSTDYNLSDRLYFEPLTLEEVLNIVEHEEDGLLGVIAQFGGQTALNLIAPLQAAGVKILGTAPEAIAATEDRREMGSVLSELNIPAPAWTIAQNRDELETFAPRIGYPVLVRPSYVLGGRGMKIVNSQAELISYLRVLGPHLRKQPVLIDQFLKDAVEVDVDAVSDGETIFSVVMEQIEKAGVHSGDSSCVYPPQTLASEVVAEIEGYTLAIARHLQIKGLMNIQFAVQNGKVFLLEVNARASRTVPFASKATGVPLARIATQIVMGARLSDFDLTPGEEATRVSVKSVVFPFDRFPTLSQTLGPEMQSTGESMGVADDLKEALAKSLQGIRR